MAKEKKEVEEVEEETENYLKYVIKDCTINITVESGGLVVLQSGQPKNPIPPHP